MRVSKSSSCFTYLTAFDVVVIFSLIKKKVYHYKCIFVFFKVLIFNFLITNDVEFLSICLSVYILWCSHLLFHIIMGIFVFLFSCEDSLYFLLMSPLSISVFAITFILSPHLSFQCLPNSRHS